MKIISRFNNGNYYVFTFPIYKRLMKTSKDREDVFLQCISSFYGSIHNIFSLRRNAIHVLDNIQNNNERLNKKSKKYNKKHMNKKKHSYNIHSLEELSVVKDTHLYNDKKHHFGELIDILNQERKYNFIDNKIPIHITSDNFYVDTTDKYELLDYYDYFKSNEFYVKKTSFVVVWNKLHLSICREKIGELLLYIKLIFQEHEVKTEPIEETLDPETNVEDFELRIKKYLENERQKSDIIIYHSNYVELKEHLLFMIVLYKSLLHTKQSYVACIFSHIK